ncbi:MAG TPA: thiol reductant ABC exporter subunit CydC [Mycobacteriales bacterium]|nr:thiol reductant ABC exporter subunit CydC [Mycobacteriales bacterium]
MTAQALPVARRPQLRLLTLGRPVRLTLALAVAAGALTVGAAIGLMAASGFLLSRASQHPNLVALSIAIVAVRALGITRGISRYVERLAGHDAALRVLSDLRASVYARLERLAPAGLRGLTGGELVGRFVADVDAVQDLFIRGITPPLVAALIGAVTVVFSVAVFAPGGAVLLAGLLVAGIGLPAIAYLLGRRPARSTAALRGELASATVDLVDGSAELIAYGATAQALDRIAERDRELLRMSRRAAIANAIGAGGATMVSGLTVFGVLFFGVAASHRGTLGTVPLAVIVLTALAAFELTSALPAAAIALASVRASARRVFAVLDAPAPVAEPAEPLPFPPGPVRINVQRVTARYPGARSDVLHDLDLDLAPGRRVGVVGRSGSGKSTLAALLLRLLDPDSGVVLINGVDASALAGDDVRQHVSGCIADPHVFDSTVRENLRLARPAADDEQLMSALRTVRLSSWVAELPHGLDTEVGPHGVAMSGGQRQRLALARAVLADPAVLILDEPTAHLDPATAAEVMRDVLAITAGRTTLLITHDTHGLDAMDEVIEIVDGHARPAGVRA